MTEVQESETRTYFAFDDEVDAFNRSQVAEFGEVQKAIVGKYLRPENTQRFRHGGSWSNPADPDAQDVQWRTHSAEAAIGFQDIVDNDLALIDRLLASFGEAMERQFAEMLYSSVSEAATRVGNVVDGKSEASILDAFVALLEKVEFMADKDGQVSLPELHTSPEMAAKMLAAIEAAPQEYKDRVEALKARKSEEAVAREAERKARFVCYGPAS